TLNTTANRTVAAINIGTAGLVKIGSSSMPLTPVSLNAGSIGFAGANSVVDITNNQLLTQSDLPTVKSRITSGNFTSSSTGGVIGYADQGGGLIKLRYTVEGDANLDGTTNSSDFTALAANFGGSSGEFWQQGDFTGDGIVNALDFNMLASSYGTQLPTMAPVAAAPGSLGSLVPEPA